jgi:hypothetical protein
MASEGQSDGGCNRVMYVVPWPWKVPINRRNLIELIRLWTKSVEVCKGGQIVFAFDSDSVFSWFT